ncbi:site-specific DNA-methyltransferase [Helicobacter muridarum]|nr:site-specific DNA-methyltransferase [Helicobacter muridarum]
MANAIYSTPCDKELKLEREQSSDINTQNVIIRGDNLDALKLLKSAYYEKIKVIYIDPPYNTKNDNFLYPDDFRRDFKEILQETGLLNIDENGNEVESEELKFFRNITGSRSHSGWLSFMLPRLKLARDLLREDGVIFISIDDNEQANLKLLCDEIFGEENFVSCIIWQKKKGGSQDSQYLAKEHEYILCYAKQEWQINDEREKSNKKDFNKIINNRKAKILKLEKWGIGALRTDAPSLYYAIKDPNGNDFYPLAPNGEEGRWRKKPENLDENHIFWQENSKGRLTPYEVIYFDEVKDNKKTIKTRTIFTEFGTTTDATKEILSIFNAKKVFDTPKPVSLIKRILQISTKALACHSEGSEATEESRNAKSRKDSTKRDISLVSQAQYDKESAQETTPDIVLDFFAGSGTTAHAVMELNKEDGGNRKFILVQLDEEIIESKSKTAYDFCKNELKSKNPVISDITIERVRRAAQKLHSTCHSEGDKPEESHNAKSRKDSTKRDISLVSQAQYDKESAQETTPTREMSFDFKVFSLVNKPEILDEKGKLKLITHANLSPLELAINLSLHDSKRLDEKLESIVENALYKIDESFYLVALDKQALEILQKSKNELCFISGYADFSLEDYLNLESFLKERLKVIY